MSFPAIATYPPAAAYPSSPPYNAIVPGTAPIQPPQAFVDNSVTLYATSDAMPLLLVNVDTELTSLASPIVVVNPALTTLSVTVTLETNSILRVALPRLNTISGTLDIGSGSTIGAVDFTGLTTVSGSLLMNLNSGLTSITFPALTAIAGTVDMGQIVDLVSASFPVLATLNGHLTVTGDSFTTVSLPLLTTIGPEGDLELGQGAGDTPFHSLSLPSLHTLAGSIGLDPNSFSSAEVDAFLNALAATVTSTAASGVAEIRINNQSPAAPPTAASAVARTYLTGLGVNIVHD